MLTSIAGHDSVLLRTDDPLIDMNYITSFTGMTDKWFYKLISEGHFPKPIKLGRSSRWYKSEVEQWMQQRIEESRGQQHETCCYASTLAMCKMPALVLWNPALPLVLAIFPFIFLLIPSGQPAGCYPFLTYSSFHSYHHSLVFVSYRADVDAYFPVCLHRLNKIQQSLKESYSVQITEALLLVTGLSNTFLVSV